MGDVVLLGQGRAAVRHWRSARRFHATVIVKASLQAAADGSLSLVDAGPWVREDVHTGASSLSGVSASSDYALYRARADVLVKGHGYPPAGEPVKEREIQLTIEGGSNVLVSKRLLIRGQAQKEGVANLTRTPIDFEHAFGGSSDRFNPCGRGMDAGPSPTVLHPDDATRVGTFAPVPASWPCRHELLNAADHAALLTEDMPLSADFDWSYFQCAPEDQQIAYLQGDEVISLVGLHPTVEHWQITLPQCRAKAVLYNVDGVARTPLQLNADTLIIEPDVERVTLLWRGVATARDAETLRQASIFVSVGLGGRAPALPAAPPPKRSKKGKRSAQPPPPPRRKRSPSSQCPPPPADLEERFEQTMTAIGDVGLLAGPFALAEPGEGSAPEDLSGLPWLGNDITPAPSTRLVSARVFNETYDTSLEETISPPLSPPSSRMSPPEVSHGPSTTGTAVFSLPSASLTLAPAYTAPLSAAAPLSSPPLYSQAPSSQAAPPSQAAPYSHVAAPAHMSPSSPASQRSLASPPAEASPQLPAYSQVAPPSQAAPYAHVPAPAQLSPLSPQPPPYSQPSPPAEAAIAQAAVQSSTAPPPGVSNSGACNSSAPHHSASKSGVSQHGSPLPRAVARPKAHSASRRRPRPKNRRKAPKIAVRQPSRAHHAGLYDSLANVIRTKPER